MTEFSSLKIVGGLLPADLLGRIFAGDPQVPGTSPQTYGLERGESVRRQASRSWLYLLEVWQDFKQRVAGDDAATSARVTRERWLRILLRELGFHQHDRGQLRDRGQELPGQPPGRAHPAPPARLGHRPGPQDPARHRPRPAVHAAGTAQPGRRLPVGDRVQRRHAAGAARLGRADRFRLRRVRLAGRLRRRAVLRLRAALPRLPGVPVRGPGRRRPRILLPGTVAELRRGPGRASARPAAHRRRAGHRHPRHRVPVAPGQPSAAHPSRQRRAETRRPQPGAAAGGVPDAVLVRRRRTPRPAASPTPRTPTNRPGAGCARPASDTTTTSHRPGCAS